MDQNFLNKNEKEYDNYGGVIIEKFNGNGNYELIKDFADRYYINQVIGYYQNNTPKRIIIAQFADGLVFTSATYATIFFEALKNRK
jgi:hypothetical protein